MLQYAFNLFSHNAPMQENGYNEEEMKMVKETHKIWRAPDVAITATCIRVPVMRAHAESINLELENELSEDEVSSPGEALSLPPTIDQRICAYGAQVAPITRCRNHPALRHSGLSAAQWRGQRAQTSRGRWSAEILSSCCAFVMWFALHCRPRVY